MWGTIKSWIQYIQYVTGQLLAVTANVICLPIISNSNSFILDRI